MNCDRIASSYQTLEYLCFGKELERRRFAYLRETAASESALVCGGGDGRFLARLLRFNPRVQVDFVDLSREMAVLAERRISGMGHHFRSRVRFHVGDIRSFDPRSDGYDLIVTHFFLDCFSVTEISDVVSRLAAAARPDSQWLISEFQEADGRIIRIWTRAVIRMLYAAFRLTTGLHVNHLPNYARLLGAQGFRCRLHQKALGGLLGSALWQAPHGENHI
jgi:ubiquinone/menaquinone biosynthesis C-methylase UbiE